MKKFSDIEDFDWDDGNRNKNRFKHNVRIKECEEVFSNKPLLVSSDIKHSQKEQRMRILGKTNAGRHLALFITIRKNKIRIISARNQNKKERTIFTQAHI